MIVTSNQRVFLSFTIGAALLLIAPGCVAARPTQAGDSSASSKLQAAPNADEAEESAESAAEVANVDRLLWSQRSQKGRYLVTISPNENRIPIGPFHPWTLEVRDVSGRPIDDLSIQVGGGMDAHGHGLPTQPKATRYLGDGRYLIEGLKLTMVGRWTLSFTLERAGFQDRAKFYVDVDY